MVAILVRLQCFLALAHTILQLLIGWLIAWLARWLAGWMDGWLAECLAGWLAAKTLPLARIAANIMISEISTPWIIHANRPSILVSSTPPSWDS